MGDNEKMAIAKVLKKLREQNRLTLADVGRICGKAFTTISSWESGKGQPDTDTFLRLMSYYEVNNILEVFGYWNEDDQLSSAEHEHIFALRELSPATKQLVFNLTQGLATTENSQTGWIPAVARGGNEEGIELPREVENLPDEGWSEDKC